MKTLKRGMISKKLGVASEGPLTKTECLRKVRILKKGLERNRYSGLLREYAVYYKNWYSWKARNINRAA